MIKKNNTIIHVTQNVQTIYQQTFFFFIYISKHFPDLFPSNFCSTVPCVNAIIDSILVHVAKSLIQMTNQGSPFIYITLETPAVISTPKF